MSFPYRVSSSESARDIDLAQADFEAPARQKERRLHLVAEVTARPGEELEIDRASRAGHFLEDALGGRARRGIERDGPSDDDIARPEASRVSWSRDTLLVVAVFGPLRTHARYENPWTLSQSFADGFDFEGGGNHSIETALRGEPGEPQHLSPTPVAEPEVLRGPRLPGGSGP